MAKGMLEVPRAVLERSVQRTDSKHSCCAGSVVFGIGMR